jgi:type II secretion system protein D
MTPFLLSSNLFLLGSALALAADAPKTSDSNKPINSLRDLSSTRETPPERITKPETNADKSLPSLRTLATDKDGFSKEETVTDSAANRDPLARALAQNAAPTTPPPADANAAAVDPAASPTSSPRGSYRGRSSRGGAPGGGFGGGAPGSGDEPEGMKIDGDKVSLQFPNNSITDILGIYERLTNKTLVKDSGIFEGQTISLVTPVPVEKEEAIKLIEASMLTNGYAIVADSSGKSARILPTRTQGISQAAQGAMFSQGVKFYESAKDIPDNESIVSFFMKLEHLDPANAATILGNHVGLNVFGRITPVTTPPGLLVTENATIVKQLIGIKDIIDQPDAASTLVTKFVPLKYADAATVAQIIQATLDAQATDKKDKGMTTIRGQAVPYASKTPVPGAPPAPAPAPSASSSVNGSNAANASKLQAKAQVVADTRLNQILIVAEPADYTYITSLITEFDKTVDVPEPYERLLKNIYSVDVLSVLADLLKEATKGNTQLPGGGTLAAASQQSLVSSSNSLLTGRSNAANQRGGTISNANGTSSSSTTSSKNAVTEQLIESSQDNAPVGVLINKTRIIADPLANSIIVIGPKEDQDKVNQLLDKLDRRSPQVYLATVIGELTLSNGVNLGVDYLQQFHKTGGNSGFSSSFNNARPDVITGKNISDIRNNLITTAFGPAAGFNVYGQISSTLGTYVNALESTNDFKIISRPSVFALNNKKAVISSGQSVPYAGSSITNTNSANANSNGSVTTTTDYVDAVLQLEVIPLINPDGEVTLRISQINNTVVSYQQIGNSTAPLLSTQKLTTTATVPTGNTIVLGGLISEQNKKTTDGVPYISRVPILGRLFKTDNTTKDRKELIVFIQPTVVDDPAAMRQASVNEDLRSKVGAVAYKTFPDQATPKTTTVATKTEQVTTQDTDKPKKRWFDVFKSSDKPVSPGTRK